MNIFRLKSNLLKNQDNRWFLQNQPYTGIIFFDKDDFQLDIFEVKNGYITKPYISPCQKTLTGLLASPISIDSSSFSNEEEDIYGCGMIPQLYQNQPYQGMSYTFIDGKCTYESYTDKEGITESKIYWSYDRNNKILDDLWQFELPNYCCYYYRSDDVKFSYCHSYNYDYYEEINISYCPDKGLVKSLSLKGNILKTKSYLNCPINIIEVYNLLENYNNFVFSHGRGHLVLEIDNNYIQELFDIWLKNNSFNHVQSLYIKGIEGLIDLSIFSNKKYFYNLSEITIDSEINKLLINELKSKNPDINIIII
ncbi:hypothetical protein [Moraxella oblonga]|uniref:hypothetical protein n=1 Tax=Moraxella oblonga TaxID=200413 RepID=UPI00083308D6|nr:hypothetical protein [Moraxella oblonga]